MHEGFTDIPQDPSKDIVTFRDPSLLEKVSNIGGAIRRIIRDGLKFVPEHVETSRRLICLSCFFWKEQGAFGLGSCAKCGCCGIKINLATERCPVGSWERYNG